jgi:hypothetical protein
VEWAREHSLYQGMIARAQVEQKEGALPSLRHAPAPGDRSILSLLVVILQGGEA